MSIGKNLYIFRKRRNLTQSFVADQLGIKQSYYAKLESGKISKPTDVTLEKLCKVLSVTKEQLLAENTIDFKKELLELINKLNGNQHRILYILAAELHKMNRDAGN